MLMVPRTLNPQCILCPLSPDRESKILGICSLESSLFSQRNIVRGPAGYFGRNMTAFPMHVPNESMLPQFSDLTPDPMIPIFIIFPMTNPDMRERFRHLKSSRRRPSFHLYFVLEHIATNYFSKLGNNRREKCQSIVSVRKWRALIDG